MSDPSPSVAWSDREVTAAVSAYLEMFERELRGEAYTKAEYNRRLQGLTGRSRQAIEYKWGNISAVLRDLDCCFIDGYKPYPNYQRQLHVEVERVLHARPDLTALMSAAASAPVSRPQVSDADILAALVPAPMAAPAPRMRSSAEEVPYVPLRVNYVALEAGKRSLGLAGEEFVLHYERARLVAAGRHRLADRVEHVAQTQGDGLGYDVLSYETSGRERLIEVKTTKFGMHTSFLVTRNEVNVSSTRRDEYALYRVFDFRRTPRLYTLHGSMRDRCRLDPAVFEARVR